MKTLLHLGLFASALALVGTAQAQDDGRRRERRTTVVIAPRVDHQPARTTVVRSPAPRTMPAYDVRPVRYDRGRDLSRARYELYEARRVHDDIVRLTRRWRQVTSYGHRHAQRKVERRIDGWIAREIAESNRWGDHGRHVHRLHALRHELRFSHRGRAYGRHARRVDAHKARVLDELVVLSERRLYRAEMEGRRHVYPTARRF